MSLPKIIYGTAWKKERTKQLVVDAVLQGFRAIDTACQPKHYREDLVGEALQTLHSEHDVKREDLFLQTKFTSIEGQDTSKPLPYDPSLPIRDQVLSSFETSLKQLGTTYLDSYVLHSPLQTAKQTLEAWRVLIQLHDDQKIRRIGMSNTYDVSLLQYLEKESGRKVQVVQNRWHQGNNWDREVCSYCLKEGIYYQSFWTLTGSPNLIKHPSMIALATKKGCTPEQLLYRYAQIKGIAPLAGSVNKEHMKHGVETEKIDLTASEVGPEVEKTVWGDVA